MPNNDRDSGLDRRDMLRASALASFAAGAVAGIGIEQANAAPADGGARNVRVELTVNGNPRRLSIDPRTTLLDALRLHLGLTGTKKGCDHGQCGACTVLIDGQRILSCLTLAAMVREPVTTIEGLASADGPLHPMQAAFIAQDAFQCGYCTPGQILSAIARGPRRDVTPRPRWPTQIHKIAGHVPSRKSSVGSTRRLG